MDWSDTYKQYFRVYGVSSMKNGPDRSAANYGGKIYIPQSALQKLTMLRISYPMLFEIRSEDSKRISHAGVLEFTAEEGRAYLPEWMMRDLGVKAGYLVRISSVTLELGTFVKIQPQSVDFLDISDPKAVLENAMRNFSALTVGDTIEIKYNDHIYVIKVLEVKPENPRHSVCVVETDLEVDFAPPIGYVDPSPATSATSTAPGTRGNTPGIIKGAATKVYEEKVYSKDASKGIKLNGKAVAPVAYGETVDRSIYNDRDAPALDLPEGQLFFGFPLVPLDEVETSPEVDSFQGPGNVLKSNRKRKGPPN